MDLVPGTGRADDPSNGVAALVLEVTSSRDDSRRRFSGEAGSADGGIAGPEVD